MYRACMLGWRRREYVVDTPRDAADGAGLVLSLAQRRRRAVYYSAPRAAVPVSRCGLPSADRNHCSLPWHLVAQPNLFAPDLGVATTSTTSFPVSLGACKGWACLLSVSGAGCLTKALHAAFAVSFSANTRLLL